MAPVKHKRGRRVDKTGRSLGVDLHVRLHHWMMNSLAWDALSLASRCLLIEVMRRHNGSNNGEIHFSVRDAAKRLHVGKNTAAKLFHELESLGFLKARQRGSFTCKTKLATTWILTEIEHNGELATRDFMRWRPPEKSKTRYSGEGPLVPEGGTVTVKRRYQDTDTVPH